MGRLVMREDGITQIKQEFQEVEGKFSEMVEVFKEVEGYLFNGTSKRELEQIGASKEIFEQETNGFSKAIEEEKQIHGNDKKENEKEQEQMRGKPDDPGMRARGTAINSGVKYSETHNQFYTALIILHMLEIQITLFYLLLLLQLYLIF
ncbi:hypothetical protein OXYTRIMIC_020 [Oxytricha trifallax]|uniref:Uncharacterized protein n=1 Tax=Oxytricha trifallax TaxID=1172189 RepID=A0A073HYM3_9SPIT|nr:hypothetical protein OXYTRIMIC_020 [Oxytricha trifallax]